MNRFFFILIAFCFATTAVELEEAHSSGIDIFFNGNLSKYHGLGIAVVANHTSINSDGVNLVDLAREHLNLIAVFTPEHGLFGNKEAGEKIQDDTYAGTPIYSLYGKNKKPSKDQLSGVDIIIFDMQDIGSRYYTYVSTMGYIMEAAADNQIQLIVLDRVNPLGRDIQGPLLKSGFSSFVGMYPIPIRHGLTIGEIAQMISGMGWLRSSKELRIEVVEILNWDGDYVAIQEPPSPNIPELQTAILYNGLCLLEGTNISEGRGTNLPFKVIGAPWLNSRELYKKISTNKIRGINIKEVNFTPQSIPGKSSNPKYRGELCRGIQLEITDKNIFNPLEFAVLILKTIYKLHPQEFKILESGFINNLYGSDHLKKNIISGSSIEELVLTWNYDSDKFRETSNPYRIYR